MALGSQNYSQTTVALEGDGRESFVVLVTGFPWRMRRGKERKCSEDVCTVFAVSSWD